MHTHKHRHTHTAFGGAETEKGRKIGKKINFKKKEKPSPLENINILS